MTDIGVELYAEIDAKFRKKVANDEVLKKLEAKRNKGKATQEDVAMLADRLGKIASSILMEVIKPDVLPGGKMYWNIAEKTIKKLMKRTHGMIIEFAADVVRKERASAGIGIRPIIPKFPEERVNALINNFVEGYNAGVSNDEERAVGERSEGN